MYYPFSWFSSLLRIVGFFLIFALIGLIFDALATSIAIGAIILLLSNYWQLYRLNNWLWHSKKITPPKTTGMWERVFEGIYYLQRRNRGKRKELGNLVKRFREGSEALPDAAVVVDTNAVIIWCNRLARIELGLRWPQDAGRRIDNFIRHPKFVEFFHSGDYETPVEVPSPTSNEKVFEYRLMPYGKKHLLLVARDVTRLSQLEQMRRDFVANVSHELRTPLTVLNGYLEMIPDTENISPEYLQKALEEMHVQSVRMQNLVEQLLVLSRIEASAERVFDKVVDVPQMLSIIEGETKALNRDKEHTITFEIDPGLNVYGIETELRSAFSNLIFNAIHYTPPKGEIKVKWAMEQEHTSFSVTDNGQGISAKHLGRLTERFYRIDSSRSSKTGGSGLGLSIVKHVLTHHNSNLHIESELGRGSVFSFSFSRDLTVVKAGRSLQLVKP